MNNIISLRDFKEEALKFAKQTNNSRPINSEYYYPEINIEKAVDELVKYDLKYNIQKGKTFLGKEILSEYSYKKDIPNYDNELDVVNAQFINFIMNSASRLTRGYSAT